ncbi:hypothetical protein AB1Y20_018479 [Prymnesium parvum]|uniref:Mitochondrial carrier protein n=1 Tax=Prymnesium parvum TaxID=97485 RepID=A0AB34JR25_PRYPA
MGGGERQGGPTEYFVAGGIAGMVSRTAIAPIERVKILFQISRDRGAGFLHIAPTILRDEGLLAFWKGNSAAVARVMPYMSLTFLSYEEYKRALLAAGAPAQPATLAAGSAAGVTAVALTYPLDLVRAAMAKPSHPYASMAHALRTIRNERGVGALYSGISATLLGVAPYAALKFGAYEALKGAAGRLTGRAEAELRPQQRVVAGLLAGMLAQTFVYPLDVVRRRMQTHEGSRPLYAGPIDALRTIARQEGISTGLFRGLSLNYLKTMPNVAIYMSLYDIVKMRLVEFRS